MQDKRMYTRRNAPAVLSSLALLALASACSRPPAPPEPLAIAAAANPPPVVPAAGPAFESQTVIHPVFNFASTAQLTQQIESAAPFDVFFAADASHVEEL